MPFRKILAALDGSEYSQRAANYAFWLSNELDAELSAQHVLDPRLVDLFVAPEFGEELGFGQSTDIEEKVFRAIEKIGKVVLEVVEKEAKSRNILVKTYLDVGRIIEEIDKRAGKHDLVIIGHRGRGHKKGPSHLMTGSVAERVVVNAECPVLVALNPLDEIDQLLVAYDGSEASIGALLAAEQLARETHKSLKALTVVSENEKMADAKAIVQQGEPYLREYHRSDVFEIEEGPHATTLMQHAEKNNSLLVMGAYGFNKTDEMVLGTTATQVVRRTANSVLVFKPGKVSSSSTDREQVAAKSK